MKVPSQLLLKTLWGAAFLGGSLGLVSCARHESKGMDAEIIQTQSNNGFQIPEKEKHASRHTEELQKGPSQEDIARAERTLAREKQEEEKPKHLKSEVAQVTRHTAKHEEAQPQDAHEAVTPTAADDSQGFHQVRADLTARVEKLDFSSPIGRQLASTQEPNACSSLEYFGEGPEHAQVSPQRWDSMLHAFNGVRDDLMKWLKAHQGKFEPRTFQAMQARLQKLRLYRPPYTEEPDLAWRGVGTLTEAKDGSFQLKLGGGFSRLLSKNPARAKFEMARLIALAWAPCGLQRAEAGNPWSAYLRCMQVDETQGCSTGGYSESGWAVSTAVAEEVAHPGCKIPAMIEKGHEECTAKFLVPLNYSSKDVARK